MNSKVKILLIIGVIICVCGVAAAAAGSAQGGTKPVLFWPDGPKIFNADDKTLYDTVDETYADVDSVTVDLDTADYVKITKGDTFSVKGQILLANGGLKAENTDGSLVIQHRVRNYARGFYFNPSGIFGSWGVGNFRFDGTNLGYVEITVPGDTRLKTVTTQVDFGSTEIDGLTADAATFNSDSGDIAVKNLTSGKLVIDQDFGSVACENTDVNSAVITDNSGEIQLAYMTALEKLEIESDFGDIEIGNVTASGVTFDLNSGSFDATGVSLTDMSLESDFGDVNIAGSVTGENSIRSDSGNVNLTLDADIANYGFDIEHDWGAISIGGSNGYSSEGSGNYRSQNWEVAADRMTIKADYGDIEVEFR
jgi:DUF4097 and DUF4098 domain-containing protein YvlB